MKISIEGECRRRDIYPELLFDPETSTIYMAPNCYCVVNLKTGLTRNRPDGLVRFFGKVVLENS